MVVVQPVLDTQRNDLTTTTARHVCQPAAGQPRVDAHHAHVTLLDTERLFDTLAGEADTSGQDTRERVRGIRALPAHIDQDGASCEKVANAALVVTAASFSSAQVHLPVVIYETDLPLSAVSKWLVLLTFNFIYPYLLDVSAVANCFILLTVNFFYLPTEPIKKLCENPGVKVSLSLA